MKKIREKLKLLEQNKMLDRLANIEKGIKKIEADCARRRFNESVARAKEAEDEEELESWLCGR